MELGKEVFSVFPAVDGCENTLYTMLCVYHVEPVGTAAYSGTSDGIRSIGVRMRHIVKLLFMLGGDYKVIR